MVKLRAKATRATFVSALLTVAVAVAVFASPAAAMYRSVVLTPVPRTTTEQAIRYLNEQRAENGIPAALTDDRTLSRGCWLHTNRYKEKPGQYPHEEIKGQPGYTSLGNDAAASSDLGGTPGDWASSVNPWLDAPLHEAVLFGPAATTAWYGETESKWGSGQDCMGVGGGSRTLQYSPGAPPTFLSLPGNGATDVVPSEQAGEQPFTPGAAVGIPAGTTTGPNILLWAVAADPNDEMVSSRASVEAATLTGPTGEVPVRIVTPDTPAPPSPAGWPQRTTVGGSADYVIPVKPLMPSAEYTLTATWIGSSTEPALGSTSTTQIIHFGTVSAQQAAVIASGGYQCSTCPHGYLRFVTHAHKITVSVGPAVGQRVRISLPIGQRSYTQKLWIRVKRKAAYLPG